MEQSQAVKELEVVRGCFQSFFRGAKRNNKLNHYQFKEKIT